jgi:hypothetical protein
LDERFSEPFRVIFATPIPRVAIANRKGDAGQCHFRSMILIIDLD